jgi:hypothetical protein
MNSRRDRPMTKCSRRISAHCSTPTISVLPGSLCAARSQEPRTTRDTSGGPDFNRRRWPSFHPAPTSRAVASRCPSAMTHSRRVGLTISPSVLDTMTRNSGRTRELAERVRSAPVAKHRCSRHRFEGLTVMRCRCCRLSGMKVTCGPCLHSRLQRSQAARCGS